MKRTDPTARWNENLALHRRRFDRCIAFLKANTDTVKEFHVRALLKLLSHDRIAKHRLYFLFLDCLSAAGGNNLTASAQALRLFLHILDQFGDEQTISFHRFVITIGAEPQNTEGLFRLLSSGQFKNFRAKKAALFMRQIAICQNNEPLRIFEDLPAVDIYQPIPLDVIIADLCSKILKLNEESNIDPSRHFEDFNQWARSILRTEYFLFEDLWYWGYFTTTVDGKNPRKIARNADKYQTNEWFYPAVDEVFAEKLDDFCKLFSFS